MDLGIALSCHKPLACTYYAAHASRSSAAPHEVYTIFMARGSVLHVFSAPASVVCTFAMNTLIAQWISCMSLLFSIWGCSRFAAYIYSTGLERTSESWHLHSHSGCCVYTTPAMQTSWPVLSANNVNKHTHSCPTQTQGWMDKSIYSI